MNTEKGDVDDNTNFTNSFHKKNKIKPNKKKESPKLITNTRLNLANNTQISKDITDIDDSPDIATWNKDVIRNKDILTNKENKFRYTKIKSPIPTITTSRLKKGNNEIDYLIDPANLNEIAKVYHNEEMLTDQSYFFSKKRKTEKKT